MGFEDREYYREETQPVGDGIPGFQFKTQMVVTSLIVLNVIVFIADTFSPALEGGNGARWLAKTLAFNPAQPWQVWTFLTNGFAHASLSESNGVFHIGFNMFTLFMLGRPVEWHLGRAEFLKFYLIAVVAGTLGYFGWFLLTGEGGYVLGASGAVSAVVIYFVFLQPHATLQLFGVFPIPAWGVGCLFLFSNFYTAFTQSNIAWQAHLAGGAFAAAYFYFKWNFSTFKLPKRSPRLKVHHPGGIDPRLQAEADRILDKISREGQGALTRKERKTLEKYSAAVRNKS